MTADAEQRRKIFGACAMLGILVLFVFAQTMRYGFVNYDDIIYVYGNQEVAHGLTPEGILRAFSQKEFGLWNPLVTISHMTDCWLYGLNAGGHHLTNVVLHLASVIILFFVFHGMTGAIWRSALAAALFAIHPLRAESVAWVSERKDVLSGLFFMLTLWAYMRYVHRTESILRYGAVLVFFVLGLMSKPMLVTLPFVLLLLDYWPLNRLFPEGKNRFCYLPDWSVVREKLPLFLLSLALSLNMLLGPSTPSDIERVSLPARLAEVPIALLTYLGQMAWPFNLAPIYPRPTNLSGWWLAATLLLGALTLLIFLLRKKHPYLLMGWLWNFGMLVPVSGILQISRHWMADHYTYLPQIGLYVALAWALGEWAGGGQLRRMIATGLAVCTICSLSFAARSQTSIWRNSESLWTHTLAVTQANDIARTNLGFDLLQRGLPKDAELELRAAIDISPGFAGAHNHLGTSLLMQGRLDEGIHHFETALRISPSFAWAHNNLGIALCQKGETPNAISHFREALQINPSDIEARYNLATALEQQGNSDEAISEYHRVLELAPNNAGAHNSLGRALGARGQAEEGILHLRKALTLQPGQIAAMANLAWMLATARPAELRNGPEAVQLANQANLATRGNNPDILRVLAATLAEEGNFAAAISTSERAMGLAGGELAAKLRVEIETYRAGKAL